MTGVRELSRALDFSSYASGAIHPDFFPTGVDANAVGWAIVVRDHFDHKEWVYAYIDEVLAGLNGLSVAEHLNKRVSEVHPELAPVAYKVFDEAVRTLAPVYDDFEAEVAGGLKQWRVIYAPMVRGEFVYAIAALVTEL